jgi:YVTN family beta-propeller protein
MTRLTPHLVLAVSAALLGIGGASAQAADPSDGGYAVLDTFKLGGEGGWDLLTVDASARRLYIARATRVMVVDADHGKLIGEIPGSGVHGVAIARDAGRGFITNGKDNNVSIFDLKTLAVLGQVAVGVKPDAIAYDPASKQVFVCNNGGTDLSVITPADGKVVATIDVGGAPELVAVDGKGRLYTNLEDKNEVGVVDTLTLKAIARWPLAPGEGPSGIAVDGGHHRVFSVCHDSKTLEVFDSDAGKVIATLPIGAGADGAAFDPSTGNIFSPNGDGTLTVIHEDDPATFTIKETASTKRYARTIALDDQTHHLYLVTADPQEPVPAKGRPKFTADSFAVLVVGKRAP